MKQRKRAMVMIFVVILIAAATTIIAASVDLSRMATYKQDQSEREAKWMYCVDSAKAIVVENLSNYSTVAQSFSQTVNGIPLTITCESGSWNPTTGASISVSGTLEGKVRSSKVFIGKRTYVNPFLFAMYFTGAFNPNHVVTIDGDLFLPTVHDLTYTKLNADCYASESTAPSFSSFTGTFYGRQPVEPFKIDSALYASNASISTVGNITLNNPTNMLSLTKSQLRYHEGTLTISGLVTGEITVFVKGAVYFDHVNVATSILSRLVVICDGDINFEDGSNNVFVMGNGLCRMSGNAGARVINGAIAAKELTATNYPWTINFDNYFVLNPNGGARYWLPGQW